MEDSKVIIIGPCLIVSIVNVGYTESANRK